MSDFSFSVGHPEPGKLFGPARLQRMRDAVNSRACGLEIVIGDSLVTWERQMAISFFRDAETAGYKANALIRRFDDGTVKIAFRNSNVTRIEVLEELYHLGQIRTKWWHAGFAARETQAGAYVYRAFTRGLVTEQDYLESVRNISAYLEAGPDAVHQLILEINAAHLRRGTPKPIEP